MTRTDELSVTNLEQRWYRLISCYPLQPGPASFSQVAGPRQVQRWGEEMRVEQEGNGESSLLPAHIIGFLGRCI